MVLTDRFASILSSGEAKHVARPEGNNDLVWKHPPREMPLFSEVVVRDDEWTVFVSQGRPAGTLASGSHTLLGGNLPFLTGLVDEESHAVRADLYFVRNQGVVLDFDVVFKRVREPPTNVFVDCRCTGSVGLSIENPEVLLYHYLLRDKDRSGSEMKYWLMELLVDAILAAIKRAALAPGVWLLDVLGDVDALKASFCASCPPLEAVGVKVRELPRLDLALDAAAVKQLRTARPAPLAEPTLCFKCFTVVNKGKFCSQCGTRAE